MKGLIAVLLLIPSLLFAETIEYGWLPVAGSYRTSLDADTETLVAANALSGLILFHTGRRNRIWIQAQYHSLDFDGTQTKIGQEVSGLQIAALYQSQYRISRHFKPWLGAGLSASSLQYKNRFLTDNQGFLAQTFADRSESGAALDFNFTTSTDWLDPYDTGIAVRVSLPINEGMTQLEAGLYITF